MAWTDPVDRQPGELPTIRRDLTGITYVIPIVVTSAKRARLVIRRNERGNWWASIADGVRWQL